MAVVVGRNWGCSGCRGLQQSTEHGGGAEVAVMGVGIGDAWGAGVCSKAQCMEVMLR